jgi:hypothetical protein
VSTIKIIDKIKEATTDYNNMRLWSGFFFDKKFELPMSTVTTQQVDMEKRKQIFLDYRMFLDYDIDLVSIGEALQILYPLQKFDTDENFYDKAVYVKNIYDNCCVFPFTGKEWHGIRGDKINEVRKLIYIDWCKI